MARLLAWLALVAAVAAVSSISVAQESAALPADRLADSVGVNIHLHHTDTPYGNFAMVQARLEELGVRHLRDGLIPTTWQPYYDRHNALGEAGMKTVFIAPAAVSDADLREYPARVARAFEAFEAPNEFDLNGGPDWPAGLRRSLAQLRALRGVPGLESFPLYGPSLTSEAAFAALGDVGALVDAANIHNYLAGRNPGTAGWGPGGFGSIAWNVALGRRSAPDRMVVATETGYWDDPAVPDSIPPAIVARYLPRLLLEQLRAGISRTYIYELVDDARSGVAGASGYGLVRSNGTPKPAFRAVAALLHLFNDPGPDAAATPIDYDVSGGGATLHRQLFRKRDGTVMLALWLEQEGYDLGARRTITVPPQSVTVTVPAPFTFVTARHWRDDGSVVESTAGAGRATVTLPVDDSLTVLEFGGGGFPAPRNVHIVGQVFKRSL